MVVENTLKTILLITDDVADAKLILDALAGPGAGVFEVQWVRELSAGLKLLGEGGIGLILADLGLPDSQGIATFEQLFSFAPQIPILVIALQNDDPTAEEAIARGAYDCLSKDHLDKYALTRALRYAFVRRKVEETLSAEKEQAQVTLDSMGDAVLCTDLLGNVTYLNLVAESITGWCLLEAAGRPLKEVFQIVVGNTHDSVPNSMDLAIPQNKTAGRTANCILIRRGGLELPIDNSVAPIRDRQGNVTGSVIVFHDVSTARAMTFRMFYLAQHDFLTDLPNRVLLNDRITQAISFAKRKDEQLALLFLDLDHFKDINDSLGHAIGDKLLQSVAKRLIACVRHSDTVSRHGGDEFVILLPQIAHSQDAALSAQKVLAALAAPHSIAGRELQGSASIGISTYPTDGEDADSLLKSADHAMYHAKKNGRNNFEFFHAQMSTLADERQSFGDRLRSALGRREFLLHYQPKIDLKTGAIAGIEALIRWKQPGRDIVPPLQFMPVAEACGLIVPIGQWVLREACTQLRDWMDGGLPPISVAVNLSAAEFRSKDFLAGVRTVLNETRLEPRFLEFELAERILLHNVESSISTFRALKELGVQLAVDDFGTGNSSLSDLKRFPVNALKIDRSFVQEITADPNRAAVASAVISMGKTLNQRVIAEGVETREQRNFLRLEGCNQAQGFYFSHPLPAEQCAKILETGIPPSLVH